MHLLANYSGENGSVSTACLLWISCPVSVMSLCNATIQWSDIVNTLYTERTQCSIDSRNLLCDAFHYWRKHPIIILLICHKRCVQHNRHKQALTLQWTSGLENVQMDNIVYFYPSGSRILGETRNIFRTALTVLTTQVLAECHGNKNIKNKKRGVTVVTCIYQLIKPAHS